MKVLVVTPRYFPDNKAGGSITGCRSFVKTLVESGREVKVLTLNTADVKSRITEIDGAQVEYCLLDNKFDWISSSGWGYSPDFVDSFQSVVDQYDLIYIRSIWNFPSLFASYSSYKRSKKYIFCASGKLFRWSLKRSVFKKWIIGFIFGRVFKNVLAVHYASIEEKDGCAHKILKRRPGIICPPTVIDGDEIGRGRQSLDSEFGNGTLKLIAASRFHEMKNIGCLVKELSLVKHHRILVQYIGDYKTDYGKKIIEQASGIGGVSLVDSAEVIPYSGLDESNLKFEFYGLQTRSFVIEKMRDSDIFVQCSHNEGLSNSVLEALAVGLGVFISPGCKMGNYRDSNGFREIAVEDGDLAHEITKVFQNPSYLRRLQVSARELYRSQFSVQSLSVLLDSELKEVLDT